MYDTGEIYLYSSLGLRTCYLQAFSYPVDITVSDSKYRRSMKERLSLEHGTCENRRTTKSAIL